MDGLKFDAVARRLASGLTRRQAVQGLVAGAVATVTGGALEPALAKKRCLKAGKQCNKRSECCTGKTGRICKQPNPPSGSKVCCSPRGEKCGGENANGPVQPQCCQDVKCSSKRGGTCR